MKSLHVTHGLYPDSIGGVQVHTYELARALSVQHEVTVLTPSTGSSRDFALHGVGVRQVRADEESPSGDQAMLTALEDLLRTATPDVVHFQHLGLSDVLALAMFERVRAAGLPCVLSLHDYWYMCARYTLVDWRGRLCPGPAPARCGRCCGWRTKNPWRWYARRRAQLARRLAFTRLLTDCSVVAPVSEHVAARYLAFGAPRDRMVVVAPGIRLPAAPAAEPVMPAPRLVVAFLGQVEPHKGVGVLLKAMARVRVPAALEVWGKGIASHARELEREARALGVTAAFHGAYDQGALDQILAAAHVVVVPSDWEEPFGLVVQEALARRRIVIASRVGGLREQVLDGVNGYLVLPRDPARLAETLDRVAAALGAGASRAGKVLPAVGLGVRAIEQEAAEWSRIYALAVAHQDAPGVAAAEFELGAAVSAIAAAVGVVRSEILMGVVRLRAGERHGRRTPLKRGVGARAAAHALVADAVAEHDFARGVLRRLAAEALHAHGSRRVVVTGGGLGVDALALAAVGLEAMVLEPDPVRADAVARHLRSAGGRVRVVASARETSGADAVFVPRALCRDGDAGGPAHLAAEVLGVGGLLITAHGGETPNGFEPDALTESAEADLSLWRRR
jgi:glycosyltransferase involved in cell wall biosynthesis